MLSQEGQARGQARTGLRITLAVLPKCFTFGGSAQKAIICSKHVTVLYVQQWL